MESLNSAIILLNNHRLIKDQDYGAMLELIAKGEATENDFNLINPRFTTKNDNIINDLRHT